MGPDKNDFRGSYKGERAQTNPHACPAPCSIPSDIWRDLSMNDKPPQKISAPSMEYLLLILREHINMKGLHGLTYKN